MGRLDLVEHAMFRLLQQAPEAAQPEEAAEEGGEEHEENFSSVTKNLRIAAIFIILVSGLAGGLPPLFMKIFRSAGHPIPRILRAMAAGVIIALACVHILPEAVLEMEELAQFMNPDYPYNPAGACAVFGALIMVVFEAVTQYVMDTKTSVIELDSPDTHKATADGTKAGQKADGCEHHTPMAKILTSPAMLSRDKMLAGLFELGCVFHSFIIGLTLGVNTEGMKQVRALIIALCFHQLLEGLALGGFLARVAMKKWAAVGLVLLYSLTCPVGIAIGIGVSDSYNPESVKAIATQGVFNGISAGMLLYIGFVQLIAQDFSARDGPAEQGCPLHSFPAAPGAGPSRWLLVAALAALFFGAAFMAMLAIWA